MDENTKRSQMRKIILGGVLPLVIGGTIPFIVKSFTTYPVIERASVFFVAAFFILYIFKKIDVKWNPGKWSFRIYF